MACTRQAVAESVCDKELIEELKSARITPDTLNDFTLQYMVKASRDQILALFALIARLKFPNHHDIIVDHNVEHWILTREY